MKVMLEEDYAAFSYSVIAREAKQLLGNIVASPTTLRNDTNALGSQIVREIVLPALEKEINEGKNFAPLRQIFYTLILAKWYKTNLKEALLNKVYADKSKVSGVDAKDKTEKDKIYQQYVEAYKKGVFNYIKEELPTVIPEGESRQEIVPRKYFSGGMQPSPAQLTLSSASEAMQAGASRGRWATVSVNANPVQLLKLKENTAAAMTTTSASVVQEGIDALVNVYRPEGPNQPFDVDELYNNLLVATINKFNANRLAMLMRTSFKVAPTFTSMILDLMLEKGLLYKIELPNVGEKIFFHYTPDELRSADAVLAAFTKGLTDMGIPTNSEDVGKAYEHAFSGSFNMKGFLAKFPDDTRIKVLADNVLYGPWVKQYDFDAAVERAASKEVRSFQPTVNDIDTAAVNEERLASFIRVGLFSDTRPALIGGLETLQRGDNIAGFEILAHQEFETQRHGLVINKIFRVVPDNGQPENFNAIEVDTLGSPLDTEGVVIIKYKAGDAVNVVYFTPGDSDEAMITTKTLANPGGIDLNTDDMAMVVSKDGVGVQMKSDSALFAKFRRGDFSGILPVIVLITPLMSILPLLGLN